MGYANLPDTSFRARSNHSNAPSCNSSDVWELKSARAGAGSVFGCSTPRLVLRMVGAVPVVQAWLMGSCFGLRVERCGEDRRPEYDKKSAI